MEVNSELRCWSRATEANAVYALDTAEDALKLPMHFFADVQSVNNANRRGFASSTRAEAHQAQRGNPVVQRFPTSAL